MKLYGTPPSHFTRKVRVVLQELGLPFQFSVTEKLMETGAANFADNPLHQIPVLEDKGRRLIESDIICEYLLENYGENSPSLTLFPQGDGIDHKIRLAMMNGAMANGVKLIRAKRSGISWDYPFFRQEQASFAAALDWLEADLGDRLAYEEGKLSLLDISLVCLADWAVFREMIASLEPYPRIKSFAASYAGRPSFASTHPAKEVK